MELPAITFLVSGDTQLVAAARKVLDSKYYAFSPIVIANQDCPALQQARECGFDHFSVDQEQAEQRIMELIDQRSPVLIITAGYNRLLSPAFTEKYRGKLINFHPSLLPAFSGLYDTAVHEAVLARGCRISGATVHCIDAGVDTGKILFQMPVAVDQFDTPETLKRKVQHVETELLPKVIQLAIDGKLAKVCGC